MTRRARSRQRGGTFTFIVLATSTLFLVTASLLTDATRSTFALSAAQARITKVREAAFGGVRWAERAALRGDAAKKGVLQLQGVRVEVSYSIDAKGALEVTSIGKGQERWLRIDARLNKAGASYALDTFSAKVVQRK